MMYPEIEIPNGYQYTSIEGWENNYKSHVPFLSTVTDVMYLTLLEVLEHNAKRSFYNIPYILQYVFYDRSN